MSNPIRAAVRQQLFGPEAPPPSEGLASRLGNLVADYSYRPVIGAASAITGVASKAIHPIATTKEGLLREAPKGWHELHKLLKLAIATPQSLTEQQIGTIIEAIVAIRDQDALLKSLQLKQAGKDVLLTVGDLLAEFMSESYNPDQFTQFKTSLTTPANLDRLSRASETMAELLERQEGTIVHALTFLDAALLDPQSGLLDQLQVKLVDGDASLLRQVFTKMKRELGIPTDQPIISGGVNILKDGVLNERDGILKQLIEKLKALLGIAPEDDLAVGLNKKLTTDEQSLLNNALNKVRDKIVGKEGLVQDLEKVLTRDPHPVLIESERLAKALVEAFNANPNNPALREDASTADFLHSLISGFLNREKVFFNRPLTDTQRTELRAVHDHLVLFLDHSQAKPAEAISKDIFSRAAKLLNELDEAQTGVVGRVGNAFARQLSQVIEPYFARAENMLKEVTDMPRKFKEAVFGAPSTTGDSSVGKWLTSIAEMIKPLIGKGVSAGSSQVAMYLGLGIDKIVDQIQGQEKFRPQLLELQALLAQLKQVQTNGDWQSLYNQIIGLNNVFNSVTLSINGFNFPKFRTDETPAPKPETIHYNNVKELRDVITPRQTDSAVNWKDKATAEKNALIENTTAFITLKVIYEQVCRIDAPSNKEFYVKMMRQAKSAANPQEELKKLFFEELSRHNVTGFKYLRARFAYWFSTIFIHSCVQKAADSYFTKIYQYLDYQKQQRFAPLTNGLIQRSTHYFANLNGAFEEIATPPGTLINGPSSPGASVNGTIKEMLRARMELPEHNDGFSTKDLYAGLVEDALEKCSGSRMLSAIFKFLAGKTNQELVIRELLDQSVSSIRDPHGYTHALNTVICELLDDVWAVLQEKPGSAAQPQTAPYSKYKKEELTAFVKNMFSVLRKTKCQTIEELRDLVKGQSTSENMKKMFEELFINDVIEELTQLIGAGITTFLKEDQLQKITYKFLNLANQAYTLDTPHTHEEAREKEEHINTMINSILRFSVEKAIDEKINASGEKEQGEVNQKIEDLKNKTKTFVEAAKTSLQLLATMGNDITTEHKGAIEKLAIEALSFETDCQNTITLIREMPINSDSRDELLKRHEEAAKLSQALITSITSIKGHANALGNHQGFSTHLKTMHQEVAFILLSLSNPNPTDETFKQCAQWFASVKAHHDALSQLSNIKPQLEEIEKSVKKLAEAQVAIEKEDLTARFTSGLTMPATSPLDHIIFLKTQPPATLELLETAIANLKKDAETMLPSDVRGTFTRDFNTLISAAAASIEETSAKTRLQQFATDVLKNTTESLQKKRSTLSTDYGVPISNAVAHTHLLDADYVQRATASLKDTVQLALPQCQTIQDRYAHILTPLIFANVDIIPTMIKKDTILKKRIFNSIQERAQGALEFIARDDTYYGALNHLALIPYVTHIGKGKNTSLSRRVINAVKDRLPL